MRIRELRAKAREDAEGNKWSLILPMFLLTFLIELIGLIPNFIENGPMRLCGGIVVFCAILFLSISGSYAIIIRNLHVARKEEKTSFISDVFGEGARNGWSCAWGIFKKIWYWVLLIVIGYVLIFLGATSVVISGFSMIGTGSANIAISDVAGYSLVGVLMILIGFGLLIWAGIMITIASYKYYLVTYLKHDYPEKSTKELLEKSKEMMDGNKAKAFVIPLTFIGWLILTVLCAAVVSVIFNLIWLPQETIFGTIPTMPIWAQLLLEAITYFFASCVTAYMQMTYCEFYLERNPLEIYNEDYVKPETNSKKYKSIIGWVFGITAVVYICISALGVSLYNKAANTTYDINDLLRQIEEQQKL